MNHCKMTTETYELKDGTKTSYVLVEREEKLLTEDHYNNMTSADTQKYFRRLGGSETATKGYTRKGYNVVKLVSKSPDKSIKKIRTFDFDL